MNLDKKPDFSGYATKFGVLCSDGRTIMGTSFKHQDKKKVPLVWAHTHDDPGAILGYAILEHRDDGMYAYGFFNETPQGMNTRQLVEHGDLDSLSIYANKLTERNKQVSHGDIKELSLVLAGANDEAKIDDVFIRHSDGEVEGLDGEAIITFNEILIHEDITEGDILGDQKLVVKPQVEVPQQEEVLAHTAGTAPASATDDTRTVQDVIDAWSEEDKNVLYFVVEEAVNAALADQGVATHAELDFGPVLQHIQEGFDNMGNVFEQQGAVGALAHAAAAVRPKVPKDLMKKIITDGGRLGSLKEGFAENLEELNALSHGDLAHDGVAGTDYGIDDIDYMFPDARLLSNSPELISRRMEWVTNVLGNTKHSPFSRVKTVQADITADEARAKGYVKGSLKKDEVIRLLRRVTTPKTIYKKQRLDRDDILDITDLDVVAWLKAEMRIMLDEELARAILVGDGREPDDPDKIDEDHIRPIAFDDEMYSHKVTLDGTPTPSETIEAVVRARRYYKGTGTPTLYTTEEHLTDLLLDKDSLGRRFYATEVELASALRVKEIITVEAIEGTTEVWGIIVNLTDYTIGADKGGEVTMFDDFDIDFNQEKYLLETRVSGALTKVKSAITILYNPGTLVDPITIPTFNTGTGVVTIPTQTGVIYKNDETGATLSSGAQTALASGDTLEVQAVPAAGYSFSHNVDADWTFTRP